jgi:hypothetical protein
MALENVVVSVDPEARSDVIVIKDSPVSSLAIGFFEVIACFEFIP